MTPMDQPRFRTVFLRLCACYDRQPSTEQRDAWSEQLARYPIEALDVAMQAAPAESGRFFPSVGLIEQLAKKHLAGTPRTTGDWHAPELVRDPDSGQVLASWRCVLCEDTGWRAQVLDGPRWTQDELVRQGQDLRTPRPDGRPPLAMRRCACKGTEGP